MNRKEWSVLYFKHSILYISLRRKGGGGECVLVMFNLRVKFKPQLFFLISLGGFANYSSVRRGFMQHGTVRGVMRRGTQRGVLTVFHAVL